jgi:hypothetical protein
MNGKEPASIRQFLLTIWNDWVSLVSGAGSVITWIVAAAAEPIPVSLRWSLFVVGVLCLLITCYRAWGDERASVIELQKRLKPKLQISGLGPSGPKNLNYRRIMVKNLCDKNVQFACRLLKTKPELSGYPLPTYLQPTHNPNHERIGSISPRGEHPVDVFLDDPASPDITLLLLGATVQPCVIPKKWRVELLISVYPSSEDGEGDERWFYIVPQLDGSVIFGAA